GTVAFTTANALPPVSIGVSSGTLRFTDQLFTRTGVLTIAAGAFAQSSGVLGLSVVANGSSDSNSITGGGTLQLVSTTGSAAAPDIFFGPDHSGNSFYGAQITVATLDLGSSQRFIQSNTGHNSVSNYYPNVDALISSSIIGSGGITYLAP